MKYMTSTEIRNTWLKFFESKGHYIEPSASLIPNNDPTLLWINAGVAALKKYFDGSEISSHNRITNAQKAIRTNDIENVGRTARHHTFFEMLGNFSIGDYFRNEVLPWAYELLTSEEYFGFDKEKLYITYHPSDVDSYNLWVKCGIDPTHLIPMEGNFWEIGEGPCGPDTEIFFDRGEKYDPENLGVELLRQDLPNDRYIEIWNIVFSQYNAEEGVDRKDYKELPSKNIDTGAGLERFACVLQETETNFETDLFYPYIEQVSKIAKEKYAGEFKMAYRVIADHIRTCTFALADGAMFSNEGRGYVLRRILRRAVRYSKKLGIEKPFLFELVPTVCEVMKGYYPYLYEKQEKVMKMIKTEEEKFASTLNSGEQILRKMIENVESLSGEDAFKLYDTYGFPLELTLEIAEESGYSVDEEGFRAEMKAQQDRARAARGNVESMASQKADLMAFDKPSRFDYDPTPMKATVIGMFKDGVTCDIIEDKGEVVFDKTTFYAEMGGQCADTGIIENDTTKANVLHVSKAPQKQHLHHVEVENGSLKLGDEVTLYVDTKKRSLVQNNHTATHILQRALKDVLGEHVAQAGSYVDDQRLRFDFTHPAKMSDEEIRRVEDIVNEKIFAGIGVNIANMNKEEAMQSGAMALFDEKYGDVVRVVCVGDYSVELCGGCHVSNSANIGLFKIAYEESVGSGIRRIEAMTSINAYKALKENEETISKISDTLKLKNKNDVITKVESTVEELNAVKKERDLLYQEYQKLNKEDLKLYPSKANYLYGKATRFTDLKNAFEKENMQIRYYQNNSFKVNFHTTPYLSFGHFSTTIFPHIWCTVSRKSKVDLAYALISLLMYS